VLIVEVADTTLRYDRADKAAAYARNAIPEYWILDLQDRMLEVYRRPHRDGFGECAVLGADGRIAPLSAPAAVIAVADLLP
jgi:Uma2 family endonuclease